MQIEYGVNPDCSESTVRINVTDIDENKILALLEKLEFECTEDFSVILEEEQQEWDGLGLQREYDMSSDTYVKLETIFGKKIITISGNAPYNNSEDLSSIVLKHIKNPEIEWSD